MKYIGLSLSFLLFLNPLLANSEIQSEKQTIDSKKIEFKPGTPMPKVILKSLSALAKTGIGLGLIYAGSFAIITVIGATIEQEIDSWDTTIKIVAKSKDKIIRSSEAHFNLFPIVTTLWGLIAGAGIATGAFAIKSAVNDLQSINLESNE